MCFRITHYQIGGSLSNDDGDGSENVATKIDN